MFRPSSRAMCILGLEGKTSGSGEGTCWGNCREAHEEAEGRTVRNVYAVLYVSWCRPANGKY